MKVGGSVISLKSYYGGYLSVDMDGNFSCSSAQLCSDGYFTVILSKNKCSLDDYNFMALKSHYGYLSIEQNKVGLTYDVFSTDQLPVGYLWNNIFSKCISG